MDGLIPHPIIFFKTGGINSQEPGQTAPLGAASSRSALFIKALLKISVHLSFFMYMLYKGVAPLIVWASILTTPTKNTVRSAKTQISQGMKPVGSSTLTDQSFQNAQQIAKS